MDGGSCLCGIEQVCTEKGEFYNMTITNVDIFEAVVSDALLSLTCRQATRVGQILVPFRQTSSMAVMIEGTIR